MDSPPNTAATPRGLLLFYPDREIRGEKYVMHLLFRVKGDHSRAHRGDFRPYSAMGLLISRGVEAPVTVHTFFSRWGVGYWCRCVWECRGCVGVDINELCRG